MEFSNQMPPSSSSSTPKRLRGKVAVVTASTAGLGLAAAERLAEEGATVVVSSRSQASVSATVSQLHSRSLSAVGVPCHVANKSQRENLLAVATDGGARKIDVLVLNAAVNPTVGPILDVPDAAIEKILDVNLKSTIALVREAKPHLANPASIVVMSSYAGLQPSVLKGLGAYAISKTALLALTKVLAQEMAPFVRVNAVAPGVIPTKFSAALVTEKSNRRRVETQAALKRLGTPEEVAGVVAFLASDDAAYVTGETVGVTGGAISRM